MIDTKELRRLAQAALIGPDGVSMRWLKLLKDFQEEANPSEVLEILDRLEDAESDALEQARLNGMGSEREAALMAKLEAAEKERDDLRAKIEAMEKQEPVWFIDERGAPKRYHKSKADYCKYGGLDLLYALPSAQPKLDEIKIALQRALELGKRETWTGARKHRSREDQREEQQCWDKVWTLLDAKEENK